MTCFWVTEKKDMEIAYSIMENYRKAQDSNELAIFDVTTKKSTRTRGKKGQLISLRMSSWLIEIQQTYYLMYGNEHGMAIFLRVLTRIFMINQTTH